MISIIQSSIDFFGPQGGALAAAGLAGCCATAGVLWKFIVIPERAARAKVEARLQEITNALFKKAGVFNDQ